MRERRSIAEQAVHAAARAVSDADAVAQACGPKGVRPRLIAAAAGPFVEAAKADVRKDDEESDIIVRAVRL